MPRLRRLLHGCAVFWIANAARLCAHEEWNNLHNTYSAKLEYVYPFDGRNPKIAVAMLNHHEIISPEVMLTSFSVNGQKQAGGGFLTFPDGGHLTVPAFDYFLATAFTGGVYDGKIAAPPAVGASVDLTFDFVFELAPGAQPVDTDGDDVLPYVQEQVVRFTNLGDNPALAGALSCSGVVRFPTLAGSPPAANLRVEVATPYSSWFPLATTALPSGAGPAFAFNQGLPPRDDWHVRISADNYETRVIPLGFAVEPVGNLDVVLTPAVIVDIDYRRISAITTPTGFWRGAVSESEGTFVAFPGQETWPAAATDAAARALRANAKIYKYKFDGTKLWEHAPGWETWAGDMTPDGRFVAYALNPTVLPFYTPAANQLVLLDGATGAVLWTKSAAPADPAVGAKLDSLEVAFSPDARWLAVGSVGSGQVTLVDRATGNFTWTVPATGTPSFGQVRRLRFSPDGQFLYCGSGDSQLRKLRVSDGAVLWRVFAGGWPFVNGIDLTADGVWLAAGTRSLDATLIRTADGFVAWQHETQFVDAVFAPDGRHVATAGGQVYRTIDGVLAGMTKNAALTRFTPDGRNVVQLGADVRVFDLGGKQLKTSDASGFGTAPGQLPQWAHLTPDGRYAILLARDLTAPAQTGIAIFERRPAATTTTAPTIVAQPLAQPVTTGTAATLMVGATGTAPLSYQWRKDSVELPGENAPTLGLDAMSPGAAGNYTCVVTNSAGSVTSAGATLTAAAVSPANPARLANLAVRANITGAPLIVGFAIGGDGTVGQKPLLVRGAGPSLGALGVNGALADPQLALFSGGTQLLGNNDWGGNAQVAALTNLVGAFPFASAASKDAALATTAFGGAFSVQLSSADGGGGTALAEIYDGSASFTAATPRLVNLSARTDAGAGASVLIAGFTVAGSAARTVLIRGIGPGLAQFGVNNALADPQLTVFRDGTVIAANDNWYDAGNALAIAAAVASVGAFAVPVDSRDAALLLSLPPGGYSVQLSGADAATGNALIEVYEVP